MFAPSARRLPRFLMGVMFLLAVIFPHIFLTAILRYPCLSVRHTLPITRLLLDSEKPRMGRGGGGNGEGGIRKEQ
jgi:hypothetical protein